MALTRIKSSGFSANTVVGLIVAGNSVNVTSNNITNSIVISVDILHPFLTMGV
jgi:hypothetical protein